MILQEILSLISDFKRAHTWSIYVLKRLLVKTIIVFTSIYFEPYCKIPSQSNQSITLYSYTKFMSKTF